jgi:NADH:ubiquinone oxidoreductase subunit F (NADH-binding)
MDENTSIPEVAKTATNFFVHESCGKCTPCREGLAKIQQLLNNLMDGNGSNNDIETILKIARTIKGSTLCPLGDAGAMSIEAMIKKFRPEFESLAN